MHAGVRAPCERLLHASHSGESTACCGTARKMASSGRGDCGWMRARCHDKCLVGTDRRMARSNRERPARKKALSVEKSRQSRERYRGIRRAEAQLERARYLSIRAPSTLFRANAPI